MTQQSIYAGDSDRLEITIRDAAGNPVDLSGVDIVWGLARTGRSEPQLTKSTNDGGITVVDASAGRIDVAIAPEDTADLGGLSYYQELQLTDANGEITTAVPDELRIKDTVID